jgi:hypothetical protein
MADVRCEMRVTTAPRQGSEVVYVCGNRHEVFLLGEGGEESIGQNIAAVR